MPGALVRNTFFGFVSHGLSQVTVFIGSVVAARLLGPAGTGVIAYAAWCITVAATIADVGIGLVLQRFVPTLRAEGKHREAEGLIGSGVRLAVFSVIAATLPLFGWLYW